MSLTVIVVTRNRPVSLRKCLKRTRAALPAVVRIIVFDDASTDADEVRSIVSDCLNATYLRSEQVLGPTGGRNACLRAATTPFCLSLDDDCYLAEMPNLSRWLADRPEDRDVAVVGFRYYNQHEGCYAPETVESGLAQSFHGGASLLRREAVLRAGGYLDYLVFACEDTELAMRLSRLGYRVWYDASVVIHHDHSLEGRDASWGSFLYVRNTVLINALHRDGLLGLSIGLAKALRRGVFATDVPSRTPFGLLMGVVLTWRYRHMKTQLFDKSRRYLPNESTSS